MDAVSLPELWALLEIEDSQTPASWLREFTCVKVFDTKNGYLMISFKLSGKLIDELDDMRNRSVSSVQF